jgi:peptidoglycan hydrolase-like protein with peptidoglycan-binding domain
MLLRIAATAAALALAAPAAAANLALLLDSGPGDGADTAFLAEALAARGYEVYEAPEPTREAMREAIAGVAGRLEEAERLLVVAAGPVRDAGRAAFLLPEGVTARSWIDASFDGVPVDALLRLAAAVPGRAAVVLAQDPGAGGPPVRAGRLAAPQGVLVLAGRRAPALAAVTDRLLAEGASVAEALEGVEGVTVAGFRAPDAGFVPGVVARPLPPAPALREPTPAESTPAEPTPAEPTPAERAAAAEAALGFDRATRRRIQQDLTVLGYGTRGIDGIFGPGTRGAIARWQEREGLAATGYLAEPEVARLRAQAEARSAELSAEAERRRAAEEAADAEFWRTTGANGGAADLRTYLDRYPDGLYAREARGALARIEGETRAEAEEEDRAAWREARARDTVPAYRRYLEARPQGAFVPQARARIAALEGAPEAAAARREAQAREQALGLDASSRALVERQLAALGYDPGRQDGTFDRATRRALREFQTRQGLTVSGFVDQQTVQALIVASLGLR